MLLLKCVWILINVKKIVFFCVFICVLISLFNSLIYILISACLGMSPCQSDIEVRHTICRLTKLMVNPPSIQITSNIEV